MSSFTIKPLVWECRDQVHPQFKAVSPLGTYYIERNKSGLFAWWSPMRLGKTTAHTIIFAKAAAQADFEVRIMSAIDVQPDPRPLSEAEAFALSAPTSAPHASMADMQEWMQEWAESIQQPDPRDEVIAGLVEALERIGGVRGPYGFPFPEANIDYGAFAVMEAREALAAAKAVIK